MNLSPPHRSQTFAFTLIELLVVIAIIGILAALLLPVFSRVTLAAKRNTAKSDMVNLSAAILQFDSTYSRLPGQTLPGGQDITYGYGAVLSNSDLMVTIMDVNAGVNINHAMNPQHLSLFTPGHAVSDLTSPGYSAADNQLRDPWGTPYVVTLDMNGDGYCADAFYSQSKVSSQNGVQGYNGLTATNQNGPFVLQLKMMIWSMGPDKKVDPGTNAVSGFNADNVIGW